MSTNNLGSNDKERFWRAVVRRWRRSGLTVRAFCQEQGLSEANFYAWRRTLGQRDAAAVDFVPVRVTSEAPANTAADGATGAVELVLSAGRCVRLGPGFDGPTLQRLLALLEEGRP